MNESKDIGRKLLSNLGSRLGFFRKGRTLASFISSGNTPVEKERFTSQAMGAARTSVSFLTRPGDESTTSPGRISSRPRSLQYWLPWKSWSLPSDGSRVLVIDYLMDCPADSESWRSYWGRTAKCCIIMLGKGCISLRHVWQVLSLHSRSIAEHFVACLSFFQDYLVSCQQVSNFPPWQLQCCYMIFFGPNYFA